VEDAVIMRTNSSAHTGRTAREASDREGSDPVVCIDGVSKSFGATEALCDVSLSVRRSEAICLIGPSGSGKSTLLRCINHLERVDAGTILVNGQLIGYRQVSGKLVEDRDVNISRQRQQVGMVFQQYNVFPHLTVLENVMCGPRRVLGQRRAEALETAEVLLKRVGLIDKSREYPAFLSGGQQQRVAIARALAMQPSVMLFDEPTSALDPETVGEVLDVMRELAAEGTTMLIATHELGFAREVAHRIVMMDHGAVVEESTPTKLFSDAAHPRTRAFLARML
jgi:polar amino acid transport system ATP-binding protein